MADRRRSVGFVRVSGLRVCSALEPRGSRTAIVSASEPKGFSFHFAQLRGSVCFAITAGKGERTTAWQLGTIWWDRISTALLAMKIFVRGCHQKRRSPDVSITSQWEPVTVRGMAALRTAVKAATDDDAVVEVTVVVIGRNARRTLVFSRGRSPDQAAAKESFVDAMFGTAN